MRRLSRSANARAVAQSSIAEHLEILHALKARSPQRAEKAVRAHLQNALQHKLETLQQSRLIR